MDKQRRVEELNSILNNIATKAGVQYITHDPSFRLADGQPNDGYLLADDLHLSNRGSNRLVKNLGLISTNTNVTETRQRPGDRVTNAVGTIFRKIFVGTRARPI